MKHYEISANTPPEQLKAYRREIEDSLVYEDLVARQIALAQRTLKLIDYELQEQAREAYGPTTQPPLAA